MTDALTTAAGFELESGDAANVSRWTKKGDRLYINDLDGNFDGGYVDLQTGEMADTDYHIKSTEVTVDGDTMTISLEGKCYGDAFAKTVVVAIDWGETEEADDDDDDTQADDVETTPAVDPETREVDDGVEAGAEVIHDGERKTIKSVGRRNIRFEDGSEGAHEDCDLIIGECDDEPKLVADGGDDGATEHVADDTIRQAIESKDDPDHPEALTVADVRDLLAHIQQQGEAYWGEWLDLIGSGDTTVAGETDDLIVLDVGAHSPYGEELADYEGSAEVDETARLVVSVVHHQLANDVCDRNWGTTYPLVLRKPEGVDDGQIYVESVMAWLRSEGCSPGQAWHYYGVEIRGYSQSEWARRGHGNRSAISKAVKSAREQVTR